MARERRDSKRIEVNIPVWIFGVDSRAQSFSKNATIINLSRRGACLVTSQVLEPHQLVLLETPPARILEVEVKWIGDPDQHNLRSFGIYRNQLATAFGYDPKQGPPN